MFVQDEISTEYPIAARHLKVLRSAVSAFLPEYSNLRSEGDGKPSLLIDKGGTTLNVRQLSDGERGVVALVLDLARRLSQANPSLKDPLREGSAIVLIDELDLHLHPTWQRTIVERLTTTFPKCQFIATTHSPQIIGEVSHDKIQIIADNRIFPPMHSFGLDSSRVLSEVMDVSPRNRTVEDLLGVLANLIDKEDFDRAREKLRELEDSLGPDDPEITRARSLMAFLESKA